MMKFIEYFIIAVDSGLGLLFKIKKLVLSLQSFKETYKFNISKCTLIVFLSRGVVVLKVSLK